MVNTLGTNNRFFPINPTRQGGQYEVESGTKGQGDNHGLDPARAIALDAVTLEAIRDMFQQMIQATNPPISSPQPNVIRADPPMGRRENDNHAQGDGSNYSKALKTSPR